MTSRLERRRAARGQSRGRFGLAAVLLALLLISVAGASFLYFSGGLSVTKPKREADFLTDKSKINILVLGVDVRKNDVGRSDTMFVVTVDQAVGEVTMLSVPRDTRVKIPGLRWDKINHAFAEGGSELSRKAAEALLGIPVDYYVTVDFAAFDKIVDAVGGVDIDVEKRMYYEDPYDDLVINIQPGLQHMDGKKAIQYVRYRDTEGDLGRIERQQKFIKAMLKQVTNPLIIPRVPGIVKEVSAAIKTDLSSGDMLNLAKLLNDASQKGLKTDTVPGKPAYIADINYWLPDVVGLREHMAQILNISLSDKYLTAARNLQKEYDASIPKEMKVVEVPAAVLAAKPSATVVKPTAPGTPTAPKETDKPTTPPSPQKPAVVDGKVRVEIVNASGAADAGEKAAAVFRNQGFDVAGISTGSAGNKNTVVISYTTNSAVVGKLTSLPFRYALQVTKDDSRANTVTVILGKDFVEK